MTRSQGQFRDRIKSAANEKQSRIVVAVDPPFQSESSTGNSESPVLHLERTATSIVDKVQASACGIKINFHLLLPLSAKQIAALNRLVHSYGLVSIADVKLNDIEETNGVVLSHLISMGFDALIVNPFIGMEPLRSLVSDAHSKNAGVIALVYMSHEAATDGYGLNIAAQGRATRPLYEIFLERALSADADGIVVGATQTSILGQLAKSKKSHPPIFSPGIGAQGATVEDAVRLGCDYLIIGRSIVNAKDPQAATELMRSKAEAVYDKNKS